MTEFRPPQMAVVPTEVAWPPRGGRTALYTGDEKLLMRHLVEKAAKKGHADGCRARAPSPGEDGLVERDLERCGDRACGFLNEVDVLHELKAEFGVTVPLYQPGPSEDDELEQLNLLAEAREALGATEAFP